jgi:hypothetical protein
MAKADFHCALTYTLALAAGYPEDEALKMGWSAGIVDTHDITRSASINAMDTLAQLYQLQPFHFIPGETSIVEPNSANAQYIVNLARIGNPYRFGIALHMLQDTFFHQGWSGLWENVNEVPPEDIIQWGTPAIGHAKLGNVPDNITTDWRWTDPRKGYGEVIDNRLRAMDAAKATWHFLRRGAPFPDIEHLIRGEYPFSLFAVSVDADMERGFRTAARKHLAAFLEVTA